MPIQENVVIKGSDSSDFLPLPKDVYQFEVLDIIAEMRTKYQSTELEEQLTFTFTCLDEEHYGRRLWKSATLKLVGGKKPSNLYTVLSGLMEKQFTKEECAKATELITPTILNSLIGKQVRLSVGQKVSDVTGKTNNTIESFLPIKKKMPAFDESKIKKTEDIKPEQNLNLSDIPFA